MCVKLHTHTNIYIYTYIPVCVCVCVLYRDTHIYYTYLLYNIFYQAWNSCYCEACIALSQILLLILVISIYYIIKLISIKENINPLSKANF